jgi:hypothetical protein
MALKGARAGQRAGPEKEPDSAQRGPGATLPALGGALLRMQRAAGNRAVSQLVQGRSRAVRTHTSRRVVQRAIGLEIEVPIPVDDLTPAQVAQMRAFEAAATAPGVAPLVRQQNRIAAAGLMDTHGQVNGKQIIKPAATAPVGFRAESDHDDRVRSVPRLNRPITENDTIMELVMQPPADTPAQLQTAVTNMRTFVAQVEAHTNNMRQRVANPYVGGVVAGIGPMDYPPVVAPRRPQHRWAGSIQVNIGIDLREYHSLLKWFADSRYADPSRVPAAQRAQFRDARHDIRQAVTIGRDVTRDLMTGNLAGGPAALTAIQRQQGGNLRGVRGWITHMALYLLRGTIPAGVFGGTAKNLAPALMKSPPQVASHYGMTPSEIALFNAHHQAIVNAILPLVGRPGDVGTPLAALNIFPNYPHIAGFDVNAVPLAAVALTADTLTNLGVGGAGSGVVPLTGGPLGAPPGIGPNRTGNAAVAALPAVPGAAAGLTRGGVVTEFRLLPGYWGPTQWLGLGRDFLRAATVRNQRGGI